MSEQEPQAEASRAGPFRDAYHELFERSADAILVIEGERFVDCNPAAVQMLRCSGKAEVLRLHPWELSPELQPDGQSSFAKAQEMMRLAFERGNHRFEWMHRRSDGEVFPVEVLLTAVRAGDRRALHVVWRDVTNRRRLEDHLRHATKMEAIGHLAGGVAHDFNNLLVSILGYSSLLQRQLAGRVEEDVLVQLREIERAGQQATELTNQLLAFGRRQVLAPVVLDVGDLVRDTQRLLRRLLGEDVQLNLRLAEEPIRVEADRTQLQQALLDLATNARDAMPGGGILGISTRVQGVFEAGDQPPSPAGELAPGRYAALEFADTGEGMSAEVQARIFDPFFTTKELGKGTGLGLASVVGLVEQSGGRVDVQSALGEGSVFTILLPLTGDAPSAPAPPTPTPGAGSGERVLLVEDDPAVARLTTVVLREGGYEVECEGDGLAALRRLRQDPVAFDLVVSDVVMPHMNGPEMARRLSEIAPGLPVLFASGYSNEALAERGVLPAGVELIRKPFEPNDLLGRVRRVLDGRGRAERPVRG